MSSISESRTGWVGWIYFAGVMMVISGVLNIINGIVAAFNPEWVLFTSREALLLNIEGWGWLHIILGLVVLLAGIGLFYGNMAARVIGVILASVSVVANFVFLPSYPFWSIVIIAIDACVIWALTVHGRETRPN